LLRRSKRKSLQVWILAAAAAAVTVANEEELWKRRKILI
jgi:hypothetical protein